MSTEFYQTAHLVVATIRVLEYTQHKTPSCSDICKTLGYTLEHGNFILHKLEDLNIIECVEHVEGAAGTKIYIKDHLKIEDIPKEAQESRLDAELKKFQSSKTDFSKKIESLKSQEQDRKKNLFAELQKQFKKDLEKK